MDIIEDTELAIEDYLKLRQIESDGLKYLHIFGILQVLYVQQDAMNHLFESLKLTFEKDKDLYEIREIRNCSIGHPTKRGNGKEHSFHFIVRISVDIFGFNLMSVYPDREKPTIFRYYHIPDLISKQMAVINTKLLIVIKKLKEQEMNHKNEFADQKMINCFPPTLSYHFEKIYEMTSRAELFEFAKANFAVIEKTIVDFKEGLVKRGILSASDTAKYILALLRYPTDKLRKFFDNTGNLNKEDISIYTFYIEKQVNELRDLAREIDEEYSS